MMSDSQSNISSVDTPAEKRILIAAVSEFAAKGFYGARTQSIAESAGANKALLHYYFRSKQKLYQMVIEHVFSDILTQVFKAWTGDGPLESRINRVVDAYIDAIAQNPGIVKIILREVVDGGIHLRKSFGPDNPIIIEGFTPIDMLQQLGEEMRVDPKEGLHIFINLVGMCVISFTSPIILDAVALIDTSDFNSYIADRRAAIKSMLLAYARTRPSSPVNGPL
jgi:AcrR family transcriptional regulator